MGFRAFCVMVVEVSRQTMAGNGRKMVENGFPRLFGRKWISACFASWSSRWSGRQWSKMVENGRKWWKKVHRGYLVGNGFSRVLRHSPTTIYTLFLVDKSEQSTYKTELITLKSCVNDCNNFHFSMSMNTITC